MDLDNPDETITAADLENISIETLTELFIPGVEGRTLDPLMGWKTVLQASVEQSSIHSITDQTTNTPCSDRVLEWLGTVVPEEFERAVNELLAKQVKTMLLAKTPRTVCLDFVDLHYHGLHYRVPTELCTTKPRDGTSKCHRYCAAFVVTRSKPMILAFTWVHGNESYDDAAERVLGRVLELDLTIECVLADRAFSSAACIDLFKTIGPTIVPVIRRGKKLAELLEKRVSYWSEYAMYEGTAREVRFPLAVCVSYQKGKRGKQGLLVQAYAACEQAARTPKQVEKKYRDRSSIETSFRTFREAMATTTSRNPGIRLVYVSVAFLLRNLWIIVMWGVLARPRRGGRALPTSFPFKRFRKWISHALDEELGWIWEVPTNGVGVPDNPPRAVAG